MGAYSYKEVMYRADYQKAIAPCMESCGATESDYDGDANYDGDAWIVTATAIVHGLLIVPAGTLGMDMGGGCSEKDNVACA